jgi:hypothetical protein
VIGVFIEQEVTARDKHGDVVLARQLPHPASGYVQILGNLG